MGVLCVIAALVTLIKLKISIACGVSILAELYAGNNSNDFIALGSSIKV